MPSSNDHQPKDGENEVRIISVASMASRANPKLAYVQIELGKFHAGHAFHKLSALHDCGCEATIIKKSVFDQIPDVKDIIVTPQPNTFISSCTGEKTPVIGSATIYMKFTGDNGTQITFPHEVHIHENLEHDFFLGRDFTGSTAKLFETPSHIYLTAENETSDPHDFWERAKNTYCDVPLFPHEKIENVYKVFATQNIVIPAFSNGLITARYDRDTITPIPVHYGQPVAFEVINSLQPHLAVPSALYDYCDPNQIMFTLHNESSNDYMIPAECPIAHISVYDKPPAVYNFSVNSASTEKIYQACRAALHTAEFIEQDPDLTEEEKLEGFHQYVTSGHYPIPMTKLVEGTNSLTELPLGSDTPLTDREFLDKFKLSHLSPKYQKQAQTLFLKHKKAFSMHDYDLGCAKDIEMEIELKPNDTKKCGLQSYIPLAHGVRQPIKEIIDQMEKYGIIRECDEPSLFVSNILVVPKKDKKELRMLLDGRILNESTIRYPMSLIANPEVISHMMKRTFFSSADIAHAFFQVPINLRSQPFTAFYSPHNGKRYCFQRCPQGLKNSPLYLKILMDKLLGSMSKYVLHYADDILIATDQDLDHHIEIVGEVLRRLEEGGIKIKPNKLYLATDSIEFLGMRWQLDKLNIPEARVMAFKNYPKPTTAKQTKSFVCAMSYYRRFLPHFAELARPLLELAAVHPKQFKWKQEHDHAFYKLIELIVTHTSLNIPDPDKPYYVQTDASDYCGAGRVFQKDDEGNERLLACVSRTFTRTERKYGVFRKETLALLYTLKSMDFFLRFANKVILLVDAKSIMFLRMCRDSAGILLRFSLELSKYEAEIFHVPGKENEISDIFSRNHANLKDIIDKKKSRHYLTEEQTEFILRRLSIPEGRHFTAEEVKWLLEADSIENPIPPKRKKAPTKAKIGTREIKNTPKTLNNRKVKLPRTSIHRTEGVILPVNSSRVLPPQTQAMTYTDFSHATRMITSGDVSIKNLIVAQRDDPQLGHIIRMSQLPPRFTFISEVLYHKNGTHYRLALPVAFLDPIIQSKHFSVMGLHFSKSRILRDIQSKFFVNVKVLKRKLQHLKENCVLCQFNANAPAQHPLQRTNLIFAPRVTWACDIIPSLPQSIKGYNAMFLAVDMFSGYIQLAPINSRASGDLIEAVLQTIIRPFTLPKYFRCDSETAMFSSYEFHAFMKPLGIEFLPCSTGAPWSNGAAERAVQTIKAGVRKFVQQENAVSHWDDYVHFFTSSHNKSTSVYGFSPEELHFGFTNPSPNDLFQLWPSCNTQQEYMDQIVPKAVAARKLARERQEKAMKQKLTYRNIGLKKKTFKPGEIVLQRNLQLATGPGKAMQTKYNGPYVIVSIDKDGSSALIEHMHSGQQVRAHFSNISHLNYAPDCHRAPSRYDETLLQYLPEKYSYEKYYGKKSKKPKTTIRISQLRDGNISDAENEEFGGTDTFSQIEPLPQVVFNTPKESIIVPSILKKTKVMEMAQEHHHTTFTPPFTSKEQVFAPRILRERDLNRRPQSDLTTQPATILSDPPRRSARIKKPPDKLQL